MDIVIPPGVTEALLGGGLLSLITMGVVEWLKSREWFPVRDGDVLILLSVGVALVLSVLFWALDWVQPAVTLTNAVGFGLASGLGASVLRDVFANVFQSRQTVVLVDSSVDVNDAQLAAAVKELDDEHARK